MNNLTVGIGADISNLQAGIASATSSISGFVSSANSRLQSFGDNISSIGQKLSIGLSIPLGLLGKQALENGAGLESLKMGLKSIEEQQYGAGKSAEYAASRFSEFIKIAKLPGIGLKEAISMSIGLRSVGFSADEAKREILAFGNTLALVGKGKNELNGVALQLQQLSGKSSGFGADLRIIKEYAPQVGAALLQAFGTLDTEAIAKTGVTGKQVIEKITTELEKLPKASAGLKTAMENVSDSVFIATGRIGEALNKSLGLTSVFDSIGSAVGTLADYFTGLSPEVQKFIGITAGVLVIAPPVLAAIGAIVGAIGAMLSPVVLIGSGIIALTAIVASNWQAITGYLKETGVWDGLVSLVTNTFDMVTSIFKLATGVIIGVFSYFGEVLEKDTFGIFNTISGIIGSAFEVIGGITKTIAGIMSGDWSKMGDGLINIATGSFQAIMTITEGFMLAFLGIFKKPFEWVGMDAVVKTFESGSTSLKAQFQGFRTELNKLGNDVEEKSKEITKNLVNINSAFGKLVVDNLASSNLGNVLNTGYLFKNESTVEGGLPARPPKPKPLTDEEKNAQNKAVKDTEDLLIKLAQFRADIIEDEVKKSIDGENAKYEKEKNAIERTKANVQVKHATLVALEASHQKAIFDIKAEAQKKESEFIANLTTNKFEKEKALEKLAHEDKLKFIAQNISSEKSKNKAIELERVRHNSALLSIDFNQSTEGGFSKQQPTPKLGQKTELGINFNANAIKGLNQSINDPINAIERAESRYKTIIDGFQKQTQRLNLMWNSLGNAGKPGVTLLKAVMMDSQQTLAQTTLNMANILENGAKGLATGFGKTIGAMIAGKAGMSDIGNMLLQGFGSILTSLGEQLIASSTLFQTAAASIAAALTPAGAGLALAAGIGLVALGSSISSSASSGGGGGASSYAQNYSSGSGSYGGGSQFNGGGERVMTLNLNMSGEMRLQGNDLVTAYKRTEKQQVRIRG